MTGQRYLPILSKSAALYTLFPNNFIGCTVTGGASTAIDALHSSEHPMGSIYFIANNQGNNICFLG